METRHVRTTLGQTLGRFRTDDRAATALEYALILTCLSTVIASALPLFTAAFEQVVAVCVAALNR